MYVKFPKYVMEIICLQNFTIFDWKYIQNMMCKRGNLAV